MLYQGQNGPSLVSEEFNQMCIDFHVEATVSPLPNPGNFSQRFRVITFRNFGDEIIQIRQSNGRITSIPGKGTAQIMLQPNESLPTLGKAEQ